MMKTASFTLTPVPPYDFSLTASYATYFKGQYAADRFHEGVYERLIQLDKELCLVRVVSQGSLNSPKLGVALECPVIDERIVSSVKGHVARLLGTAQELGPFYEMALKDPVLKPLVQSHRGLHIPQTFSVWEALVLAIIGQQVSSHVARMIRNNLVETYGPSRKSSGTTFYAFPGPEPISAAGVEELYAIKLSKRKAQYIFDIATSIVSGEIDLEGLRVRSDREIVRELTDIRGVGPWTAHWLLIRGLERQDAFPEGDLALRRTMARFLQDDRLTQPEEALKYSLRWSPYRSFATAYLFSAMRSGKLPIQKN